jgi:hypothetical protein
LAVDGLNWGIVAGFSSYFGTTFYGCLKAGCSIFVSSTFLGTTTAYLRGCAGVDVSRGFVAAFGSVWRKVGC